MSGLDIALTPLRFLKRATAVRPDKIAVIDGNQTWTYIELSTASTRCDAAGSQCQLVQALRKSGIRARDRVAYLAFNSVEMLLAHFAVPPVGGVLIADAPLLRGLGIYPTFDTVREIVETPARDGSNDRVHLLARGCTEPPLWELNDDTSTVASNCTFGTTGRPKGVMCAHRGALSTPTAAPSARTTNFSTRSRRRRLESPARMNCGKRSGCRRETFPRLTLTDAPRSGRSDSNRCTCSGQLSFLPTPPQ
jgi:non-ribosomal peptide synthetase component F